MARRNEDGAPSVAINKHDEELLVVIGWQRSHNVYRQRVPWPLRLDGPRRLLTAAIIAGQLTLGTTLRNFKANAVTGLEFIAIAEELPQRPSAEMGGRVELSCEISSFALIFYEANLEENIFWGCGVIGQPAETIDVGLSLPSSMLTVKSYSSSAADQRWRSADPVRIVLSHCKA